MILVKNSKYLSSILFCKGNHGEKKKKSFTVIDATNLQF